MAAQLCPCDTDGEHFFHDYRIREFTARATIFELRRYMITLRARSAFLHGLDAFAAQHAKCMEHESMCYLIRNLGALRVIHSNRRDHEWDMYNDFSLKVTPQPNNERVKAAEVGKHWRGDCRDCGLSDTLAANIAAAELRLVNEEIERGVTNFEEMRRAYVSDKKELAALYQKRLGSPRMTRKEYEEATARLDAHMLTKYTKMHEMLRTLIQLGVSRTGMGFTNIDDFFLCTWVAWGQGCNAAAKRAVASASLAPRYLCLFAHIADQMRQDRLRFTVLQGLRLNLDLPDSKRVKKLAQTYAQTGAIGA